MATTVSLLGLTPAASNVASARPLLGCVRAEAQELKQGYKGRRRMLGTALLFPFTTPALAYAYVNKEYSEDTFQLSIPDDWIQGEGKVSGTRKLIAFHPADDTSANVNVVISNLGPDFTSLGSFGSVDSFAANMVGSMDRSRNPNGLTAKLVDSVSKNGLYYVEYTVAQAGKPQRHLTSAVGISIGKFYNRLVTVTGQYLEEDADKYKALLEQAIASFKVR